MKVWASGRYISGRDGASSAMNRTSPLTPTISTSSGPRAQQVLSRLPSAAAALPNSRRAKASLTMVTGVVVIVSNGVNPRPPSNGIRFINRGTLHIEDTVIRRFNAANSAGISVAVTAASKLFINNVTVAENGNLATGGGIVIAPGVGGSIRGSMTNSRVRNNANNGLRMDSTNGAITMVIQQSDFSGNATGISLQAGQTINAMLTDSIVSNNSVAGITGNGPAFLRTGNTSITGNTLGVQASGGAQLLTYGNNRLLQNPSSGVANNGNFIGVALGTQ